MYLTKKQSRILYTILALFVYAVVLYISNTFTPADTYYVPLIDVVDGDTIKVLYEERIESVRLIGIDTPESVHPDETLNTAEGQSAAEHTKELLKDVQAVYLEFDEEQRDKYGRLLAYVWLDDCKKVNTASIKNRMLNGMILRDGYAKNVVYKPNDKYAAEFSLIALKADKKF